MLKTLIHSKLQTLSSFHPFFTFFLFASSTKNVPFAYVKRTILKVAVSTLFLFVGKIDICWRSFKKCLYRFQARIIKVNGKPYLRMKIGFEWWFGGFSVNTFSIWKVIPFGLKMVLLAYFCFGLKHFAQRWWILKHK